MTTEEHKVIHSDHIPLTEDEIPDQYKVRAREAAQKEQQIRTTLLNELIEEVEKVKDAVHTTHGTSKYDSCYDDCLEILKSHLPDKK